MRPKKDWEGLIARLKIEPEGRAFLAALGYLKRQPLSIEANQQQQRRIGR
jgi:hypothetical protein